MDANRLSDGNARESKLTLLASTRSSPTRLYGVAASLEDIISAKLAAMGLENEDNTTFILGIVEEDSFEPEVRLSRPLEHEKLVDDFINL